MRERRMPHVFPAKPSIYAARSSFFFAPLPYDYSTTGREASRIGRPPETGVNRRPLSTGKQTKALIAAAVLGDHLRIASKFFRLRREGRTHRHTIGALQQRHHRC